MIGLQSPAAVMRAIPSGVYPKGAPGRSKYAFRFENEGGVYKAPVDYDLEVEY